MRYISITLLILSLIFVGCSDNSEAPKAKENKLVGYWAITHIKEIEHIGGVHNTTDKVIPPHGTDSYPGDNNYRYDVLIFDEDMVTVRGDMPSCPKSTDYDLETVDGQIEYEMDFNEWHISIGEYTDEMACPVGEYSIKSNSLIIGSLNMGIINFVSDDEFTLDYKKSISNSGDYKRLIYTYTRIYSLKL